MDPEQFYVYWHKPSRTLRKQNNNVDCVNFISITDFIIISAVSLQQGSDRLSDCQTLNLLYYMKYYLKLQRTIHTETVTS